MAIRPETATPSPSLLLYLNADRVVPHGNRLTGFPVPGKDVHVKSTDLANLLLGAAFWGLRERGLVTLAVTEKKVLFFHSKQVQVTAVRAEAQPGLAGELLAALGNRPADSAHDIVYRWFGRNRANPQGHVVHAVVSEAASLGLLDSDAMGGLIGLGGGPKSQPDPARLAELAGPMDEATAAWEHFRQTEAELAQALLDQCKGAVQSRAESTDAGGGES